MASLLMLFQALLACLLLGSASVQAKPNFLFILTDDQDLELGSLEFMNRTTKGVQDEGFTFGQHYATCALCCPSRVSLLRGQQAHNTNNTDTAEPGGGFPKFVRSGENDDYLPRWMQDAGYHTEYIGKFLNLYSVKNYNKTIPKFWDNFDGLVEPFTYRYNDPAFSMNGKPIKHYKAHQTDVIRAKALDRMQKMIDGEKPWFLTVAPVAVHQEMNKGIHPPIPAKRHQDMFPDLKARLQAQRPANFNPKDEDHNKPGWVGQLPPMTPKQIAFSDETYLRRAQTLQGVDEMVGDMLDLLQKTGELENTYVIYSSDQGYHLGNHRVTAGKKLPYREDTHIPFFMRGPNVPKGASTDLPSSHIDVAPTLLTLAELEKSMWPDFLDGRDLSAYWKGEELKPLPETINVEFWGMSTVEIGDGSTPGGPGNNTYKTVRIVGDDYGYLYSHWCSNEVELYDTVNDPHELHPLDLKKDQTLANRLNGLLLALKTCEGETCRDPWGTIHKDGSVKTLKDALKPEHDDVYKNLPRVNFDECLAQHIPKNEAPFFPEFEPKDGFGLKHRAPRVKPRDKPEQKEGKAENKQKQKETPEPEEDIPSVDEIPEAEEWGEFFQHLEELNKDATLLSDKVLEAWSHIDEKAE